MQTILTLDSVTPLDKPTAALITVVEEFLRDGKISEACRELRKIPLKAASHPAVVELRRRLVSALFGYEAEEEPAAEMALITR